MTALRQSVEDCSHPRGGTRVAAKARIAPLLAGAVKLRVERRVPQQLAEARRRLVHHRQPAFVLQEPCSASAAGP